ncbi:MAG: DUF1015 domain-containing protein [Actinomycetota bacterium]|nr:DUF1015 domain-containing protein [Actinomycetota bacterium]
MPDFFPFPGVRYRPDACRARLEDLTAPPYDVIDAEARARLEAAHPMNAVHLILPRDQQPGDRYQRAAQCLQEWRRKGVLEADPPRLYLYRMAFTDDVGEPRVTTGVVGALALSPPGQGDVLPHERTMSKPRGDRLELLRATRANLDPVWVLSMAPGLSDLLALGQAPTSASCIDADGVEHCLVALPDDIAARVSEMVGSAPVVIADGHHRYETAVAFSEENLRHRGHPESRGADRIMALVVELAARQLCVRPIHRLLIGAGPGLRERLAEVATITPAGPNRPEALRTLLTRMDDENTMGVVDGEGLALLALRLDVLDPELERLPASLRDVDSARLEVALGSVGAPEALDFHADPATVAAEVAKGTADAGVFLRAVSVAQIQAVAAAGERMPEKTTYFSPKPLTGMVFRVVED